MKRTVLSILLVIICTATAGLSQFLSLENVRPLFIEDVNTLDINRVNGTWYSLAGTGSVVESGCHCQRTTYVVQSDQTTMINTDACRMFSDDGFVQHSPASNMSPLDASRLHWNSTSMGGLVSADYNFVSVDSNYEWVLTSSKGGSYSWVLSKNKTLDSALLDNLKNVAKAAGLNVDWEYHTQNCPDFS